MTLRRAKQRLCQIASSRWLIDSEIKIATGRRDGIVRKAEHAALPKVQDSERTRSAMPRRVIFSQSVVREIAEQAGRLGDLAAGFFERPLDLAPLGGISHHRPAARNPRRVGLGRTAPGKGRPA